MKTKEKSSVVRKPFNVTSIQFNLTSGSNCNFTITVHSNTLSSESRFAEATTSKNTFNYTVILFTYFYSNNGLSQA